ncbi:tetratricopeptide repeat protein [Streptomyces sp. NPDC057238]|uniref:tetratricopeptide repeat protein n=1 Tax=Streptomyces sp. NPDC057238 TaxID=3346060 RepID=UPI0036282FCE
MRYSHRSNPIRDFVKIHPDELKSVIRRRAQARFVGRRAQLSLFAENLAKDPQDEANPADFLFHVRGVGGVGKSTLLRQWRERARGAGAVTAVVDESDVHGVPQALTELARQLAEQTGPLKEFDRAAEQYRKEQEAVAEPVPQMDGAGAAGGEPSMSSRVVSQAALGAASLIPGVGVVTAMANPDVAAQGLDRLRSGAQARGRRGRGGDVGGLSRAFVSELDKLCGRYPWVVLFFDTWEQTGRYLDGWLREFLDEACGPVPANVIVVLAGRDELPEREWAPLRALVADVPLEMFTEAETRALLAARGVTAPEAVEAVLELSMGLPLLVDLLAHARPSTAEEVDAGEDVADAAVERFVQWITDPHQRETVLACALAPRLNEDVFTAAAPQDAGGLWEWLCGQPFVSGHGGFKQYHAVVRASMLRRQRTQSPQRWTSAHLRLADAHAAWRATAEHGLSEDKRWSDPRWLQHRLDETYHRLCAQPATELHQALEQAVHAAGQDTAGQWIDVLEQAARDTADPTLSSWADRLRSTVADDEPALACLTALLTHGQLNTATRAWCHTYRGRHLHLLDREEEAIAELDRAIAANPHNARAWVYRGEVHRQAGRYDEAVAGLTAALQHDPTNHWALILRGTNHTQAGQYDQAVADLTTALQHDPTNHWALTLRGAAHTQAEQYDQAIADLTTALQHDPTNHWALTLRGQAHALRATSHIQAARYDEAVADLTTAFQHDPTNHWALTLRGTAHTQAGQYDQAIADLTTALQHDPTNTETLILRATSHTQAARYDEAVADLTTAFQHDPTNTQALTLRGTAHTLRATSHAQAGRYDEAVADLTTALQHDPTDHLALCLRGQAHIHIGQYDKAVADFTTALEIDPTDTWALAQRGVAHRQAGDRVRAREDLELAIARTPGDSTLLFEKTMLDTVEGGITACVEQWTELLTSQPETPDADVTRFFALFRVLLLEHDSDVAEATAVLLSSVPDHDTVTDLLLYLAELSTLDGEPADRARQCRRLIEEWERPGTDGAGGLCPPS